MQEYKQIKSLKKPLEVLETDYDVRVVSNLEKKSDEYIYDMTIYSKAEYQEIKIQQDKIKDNKISQLEIKNEELKTQNTDLTNTIDSITDMIFQLTLG